MKPLHIFTLLTLSTAAATAQPNVQGAFGRNPYSNWPLVTQGFGVGFIETSGQNAITILPNYNGYNYVVSDYFSGNTRVPLILSGRGTSNDLVLSTSGNVGIGTTTPGAKLENYGTLRVSGDASIPSSGAGLELLYQLSGARGIIQTYDRSTGLFKPLEFDASQFTFMNGNVGIGTTNPMANLDVATTVKVGGGGAGNGQRLMVNTGNGAAAGIQLFQDGLESWEMQIPSGNTALTWSNSHTERLRIDASGNVGIGTTSPTEKLSVNGRIRAKEIIVETTGWSDHVFADSYKLQPLAEVEQHIKTEKHLPGVPSAQEVAVKGVSVGDMQAILLAKIEELTLHQIAQEKEIARLRESDTALRAQVQQLQQSK